MNRMVSLGKATGIVFAVVLLMALGGARAFAQKFQIVVKAPSGGEQYAPGDEVYIAFYLENPDWPAEIGNWLAVEYNNLDQKEWFTIEDKVDPYTNEMYWRIPEGTEGGKYQIRVREVVPPVKGAEPTHFEGYSEVFVIEQPCTSPFIIQQPLSATVCTAQSHTFRVTATGGTMQYRWRRNGITLATTFSNAYTVPSVAAANAGAYDVVITDLSCGITATSSPAQLTVLPGTVIERQLPSTTIICEGGVARLSVETSGTVTSWQWRRNGVNLANGRDSVYTIDGATATTAGVFDVVVGSTCGGPLVASPTSVVVNTKPRITQQPTSLTLCPGVPGTLSVMAVGSNLAYQWYRNGEPVAGGTTPSISVTAQSDVAAALYHVDITQTGPNPNNCDVLTTSATASVSAFGQPRILRALPSAVNGCLGGSVVLTVDVAGFDLRYTWMRNGVAIDGVNANSLTLSNLAVADEGDYSVRVEGACGLAVTVAPTTLRVITLPVITDQSATTTIGVGESTTLTVQATYGRDYQWYRNGAAIAGATMPTLAISRATMSDAGVYHAIVRNDCGAAVSAYIRVRVIDPTQNVPELTITQSRVDLGQVPVGHSASITVPAMLTNTGRAPLDIQSISVSRSGFAVVPSQALPLTLQAGQSIALTVTATAAAVGGFDATVTVATNAPVATEEFAVLATGVVRYSIPTDVDFAEVDVSLAKELCITLANTSAVDVSVSQAALAGVDAAMFSLVTPMPLAIAAGSSADVCIRYAPTLTGEHRATLDVVSVDGGNSTVAVRGRGVPPTSVAEAMPLATVLMPNPASDHVVIGTGGANVERIDVVAANGGLVYSVVPDGERIDWNLRSGIGAMVPAGVYTVVFRTAGAVMSKPLIIIR